MNQKKEKEPNWDAREGERGFKGGGSGVYKWLSFITIQSELKVRSTAAPHKATLSNYSR